MENTKVKEVTAKHRLTDERLQYLTSREMVSSIFPLNLQGTLTDVATSIYRPTVHSTFFAKTPHPLSACD